MSSAFLYLAIVAIWACVLVPRWLRRDSAVTELATEGSYDDAGYWESEEEPADAEVPADTPEESPAAKEPQASPVPQGEEGDRPAVRHPDPGESRRRVLAARRRLLGMLLLLAAGATCLALAGLAAWWVMLPPLVMLAGYVPLLRAAARMDTERARHAEHTARSGRPEGSEQARRSARSQPSVPSDASVPSEVSEPPGTSERAERSERTGLPAGAAAAAEDGWHAREGSGAPVPPPDAEVIDISAQVGEYFYDQYTDARLRAVGDLSHHPADDTMRRRLFRIWPKWRLV